MEMLCNNADITRVIKGPAKAADQIDDRVEQAHRLPDRRQHTDRIERSAQERQRCDHQQWHDLEFFKSIGPNTDNKSQQRKRNRCQNQETKHRKRMRDLKWYEETRCR